MKRSISALVALAFAAGLGSAGVSSMTTQTPPVTQDANKEQKEETKKEQEPRPNEDELRRKELEERAARGDADAKRELDALKERLAKEAEKKDEKWDVNNPPGRWYDAKIDTDEGTWMSVDVSPDGREIIFDLLGDIYSIPSAGGEAKALTSGIAWDMQPRFSPNGKWIAFTSDREGGDNIWIMDRDGKNPKQVTKETFRLLNSPAWSPDSDYIVARKHFTSRRSLGAGEMWLYHRTGGDGVQLTKKRTDQKDSGEPAFSPDGRYLYYSDDVTPGAIFEYNKDPNTQIYVIQRLDRETGETERFVTGAGGSIRPTPSHDGKRLAFIRRIRTKSVLHVADLQTGVETPIYDALDRDMQETWAVHGVYPTMAWTPDDKSLVFWAGGKIRRIDVASRQVADIPFHVSAVRRVDEALHFPQPVAPESFDVRMLRWVRVNPAGTQVVYQALGHIYVRDLPGGTPRRLTRQTDHFEFYPSWSRDGRSIVYVTWDDQKLGSIRVAPAAGGEGRAVTRDPGHYVEPAFTPDGSKIVYRKTSDGFLTTSNWGRNPGVYAIPAAGGAPVLVTKRGINPQFGATSDRVYLMEFGEEDKRLLTSIELDGSDARTHYSSERAAEYRISPDEKWVAWVEGFNAYISPFVRTGKGVDIGPQTKAVPVARVTRDAGDYLQWSGDSRTLYWSLGPELFSREVKDAFTFLEGSPEKAASAPEKGINISFSRKYDQPSGTLAFTGARIVSMKGDEVIEDGTIVVTGNRITAVGRRGDVTVPAGAKTIDAAGKTIMPGIVDVHWHGGMGNEELTPEQSWVNYASLAFGVTTIHDPSNNTSEIFAASELAKNGQIVAPRIFSTGTILYGAKAAYKADIESLADARAHLRRMKAVGAFSVKSYNQPRRNQRQQVIAAARELEMLVVPEGGSLFQHNMTMVVDGHTGIEHSIPVAKIYKDVHQLWSQSRTAYTPTLVVGYGGLWGENYWYQKTNVWENQRLLNFVPREVIDERSRRRVMAPDDDFNHFNNAKIAADLGRNGVGVQIGAHGQREGLAAHWEIWMLTQGGLSPHAALRAATIDGARYLGMDREIGSIEPGKLADFIVLDRNPLANIRDSESIRYTVVNGRVFDAMSMNELGNHPRTREKFFFEDGVTRAIPAASHALEHD